MSNVVYQKRRGIDCHNSLDAVFHAWSQTFAYLCVATTRLSTYVETRKDIRSNGCF